MTTNISELERIEQAMTQGEWLPCLMHEDDARISGPPVVIPGLTDGRVENAVVIDGCGCCGSPSGKAADITGICAMRAAFPKLLAIARAARELMLDGNEDGQHGRLNILLREVTL